MQKIPSDCLLYSVVLQHMHDEQSPSVWKRRLQLLGQPLDMLLQLSFGICNSCKNPLPSHSGGILFVPHNWTKKDYRKY